MCAASPHLRMYSFGCMFSENLRNRFKSNEDLCDGEYKVRRKNNVYVMSIGPIDLHTHRIDQKSRIPKGAKSVKKSIDSDIPVQVRFYLKDGKLVISPECPGNIVLAVNAHPESGLSEIFVGILGHGQIEQYEWRKIFPVYSRTEIDTDLLESAFLDAEEDVSPVIELQNGSEMVKVERPREETEPGKIVSIDEYKSKRNTKDGEKD